MPRIFSPWIVFLTAAFLFTAQNSFAADAPTTQPLSAKSSIDDVLDALDARGKSLQDFTAKVSLTETDNATGADRIDKGTVELQKKGDDDARVKIQFDKKVQNEKEMDNNHCYVLDGGKLVERDYQTKNEVTRQIIKPGQKMNLLKLGEGPFPLPIGQKKEDVKAQFDVQKIDPAKDDPANTIHLKLTPKKDTSFAGKFKTLDIWVDLAGAMPRRIETLDPTESTVKTTDLTEVKINGGLKDSDFTLEKLPPGWTTLDEPYHD